MAVNSLRGAFRRAKVVCTVGPASREPDTLRALTEAGMDAVRVNFSHASHQEMRRIVEDVRALARETGRPLAVIADLQGPRIRVGELGSPMEIQEGVLYRVYPQAGAGAFGSGATDQPEGDVPGASGPGRDGDVPGGDSSDANRENESPGAVKDRPAGHGTDLEVAPTGIPTTYTGLADDVAPGDRILLDDGRLELGVVEVSDRVVLAEARDSGVLESNKGINLPGVEVQAPSLTEKDLEDLEAAQQAEVDYVALSFVRRPEDVERLRRRCDAGRLIISKIEKDRALEQLEGILRLSDAVMVARGDLGVELPYEEVPLVQKRIIDFGQWLARPSITATQMLDSMIRSPRPSRAEVSDVANALMDGTDAVMLSAETAVGEYPVDSVRTMVRIIRRIEQETSTRIIRAPERAPGERAEVQRTASAAIAAASLQAVDRLDAPFVVTLTRSGFTARVLSAQRPSVPILAVTDQWLTFNQLALVWGVRPVLLEAEPGYEDMVERAREVAVADEFGERGDPFVVTAGVPFHVPGTTNMMRIEEL